ncbi:hypothetical protein SDC9_201523 [bioreactor metagenome]|uniref:Uncharacterized protein n=1 Tax=bioreactor metagenome TaxID=1076179 RepID=A0A645IR76_9ZZZZ
MRAESTGEGVNVLNARTALQLMRGSKKRTTFGS